MRYRRRWAWWIGVLADNGYATGSEVSQLEGRGVEVLVATGAEGQRRRHDFRPQPPTTPAKAPQADWIKAMQEKMELSENRAHYRLHKQTVEPVFGIVKHAMGFRQFLLRGFEKVEGEWALVTLTTADACTTSGWLERATRGRYRHVRQPHQRRRKGPTTALSTTNEMRPVPIRPKRLARSHNRRSEHAPRGAPGRPRRT